MGRRDLLVSKPFCLLFAGWRFYKRDSVKLTVFFKARKNFNFHIDLKPSTSPPASASQTAAPSTSPPGTSPHPTFTSGPNNSKLPCTCPPSSTGMAPQPTNTPSATPHPTPPSSATSAPTQASRAVLGAGTHKRKRHEYETLPGPAKEEPPEDGPGEQEEQCDPFVELRAATKRKIAEIYAEEVLAGGALDEERIKMVEERVKKVLWLHRACERSMRVVDG